jgi:hypothetical protein
MANNESSKGSPQTARGDRGRKAVLGAAAGAIPLALSMLVGSTSGTPAKTRAAHRAPLTADSSDLQFHPGCRMPFTSNPIPDIDGQCSIEGAGNTDAKIAESKAKNDFCVPTSNVTPIQHQTFVDLGTNTSFRSSADRSPLAKIPLPNGITLGEGRYVQYQGFLLHAQYSNKSSGEAVNCNIPGEDTNDIHIQMVEHFDDDDACDSVTAQMSPHFRPESWTPEKLNSIRDTTQGRLIRLSGPLFYDGSHTPCHDGKRPNPQRASVWEIHPVYSVDVCQEKGANCQHWIPLDEWNGIEGEEEEGQ